MQIVRFEKIDETLFTKTLSNGLKVFLLPKKDYSRVYALFSTNYGSVDNSFIPLGQKEKIAVPDGIAHFLEHKLFEKEDGDVFQKFTSLGVSSNAFTTFTKTSYLFSTTDHVLESLTLLLDFVQRPYFEEESVEREKGIIAQEIQMYQDDPDWRLFFGILQNMYPDHPLAIDIAGSVESIQEITAKDLYTSYHTFYHPSNMCLFLVGDFNPEEMLGFIEENQHQKTFEKAEPIERFYPEIAKEVIENRSITMPVIRPKFILGLRGEETLAAKGRELLKYKMSLTFFSQALFGPLSQNFLNLYNQGMIDDSFDEEFSMESEWYFMTFSGDSDTPHETVETIKGLLQDYQNNPDFTEEMFQILKKRTIGKYFQSLNSLEYIANQFSQNLYEGVTLFELPEILAELTFEEVQKAAETFMKTTQMSEFYILPEE